MDQVNLLDDPLPVSVSNVFLGLVPSLIVKEYKSGLGDSGSYFTKSRINLPRKLYCSRKFKTVVLIDLA